MKALSDALSALGPSLKSIGKMLLLSRCPSARGIAADPERPLIIMANGPSLAATIADSGDALCSHPTMAVNFAAIAPEFTGLRPRYYILADPAFFTRDDANFALNWQNIAAVTWPMTLLVPVDRRKYAAEKTASNPNITVATFNPVGVEGWHWLENMAYSRGWGMPRPRNVLIPAIMTAILMGYRKIYITGADHSWMKTISVNDRNEVVSIQPHFYKDNDTEQRRVRTDYLQLRLHDVVYSFYVAFRSYHQISRFADSRGVEIYNSTPGSFIDAFPRRPLP